MRIIYGMIDSFLLIDTQKISLFTKGPGAGQYQVLYPSGTGKQLCYSPVETK